MPDLGQHRRAVRPRPTMVQTRGYDPTQPNKTSFLAPPKTYLSTDVDFIWSGMIVTKDTNGLMVPATAADLATKEADQFGYARQDANRFDVVQSRLLPAISNRSDVELRTAWFDRSQVYVDGDPLTIDATSGQLTLAVQGDEDVKIVARVSGTPRFSGGNPRIGGVSYNYLTSVPVFPAVSTYTPITGPPAVSAAAQKLVADQALITAWLADNPLVTAPTAPAVSAMTQDQLDAYRTKLVALRQSTSDIHSFEATDNSMLTIVPSFGVIAAA